MKRTSLFVYAIIIMVSACAQPGKPINDANAEKRQASGFHAIKTQDGIDLYLTQGNEEAVAVSAAKPEYRERIVVKVENGVLQLSYDDNFRWNWRSRKLRAYISFKDIDAIHASGGSDILIEGSVAVNKLSLELSGGSDFVGDVRATDLTVGISGGSDVDIKGSAINLRVSASGGSDFKGYDLATENAAIDASGGSDAELSVSKELAAEASGGSDIDYKGSPSVKRSASSGGSSVKRRS